MESYTSLFHTSFAQDSYALHGYTFLSLFLSNPLFVFVVFLNHFFLLFFPQSRPSVTVSSVVIDYVLIATTLLHFSFNLLIVYTVHCGPGIAF